VVGGVAEDGLDGGEVVGRGARDENTAGAFGEAGGDLSGLFGGLAHREDGLREGVAEGAMVVDLGEADVLVGEETQLLDGGFDACRAARDALEEITKLLLVDLGPPLAGGADRL
jgi:hypothetical protein